MSRAPRIAAAALAAGAGIALAGCGGGGPRATTARPPPAVVDSFAGQADDGVGASVDLSASDPVIAGLRRALARPGGAPRIAIAAVLNESAHAAPLPGFAAVLEDGRTVPLRPAWAALGGRDDRRARRLRAELPSPGPVAPKGTATMYLILGRSWLPQVAGVRMRTASGASVDLEPQSR